MSAKATIQNLLWEKNPAGIQDFTYPFTEAELVSLYHALEEAAMAEAEAEWEAKAMEPEECQRHHCECCEN